MKKLLFEMLLEKENKQETVVNEKTYEYGSKNTLFAKYKILLDDEVIKNLESEKKAETTENITDTNIEEIETVNFETKINSNLKGMFIPKHIFENRIKKMLSETLVIEYDVNDPILNAILQQIDMVHTIKNKLKKSPSISKEKLDELEKIIEKNIELLNEK